MGLSLVGAQQAFGTSSGFSRWTCSAEEEEVNHADVSTGTHYCWIGFIFSARINKTAGELQKLHHLL